MLRIRVSGFTLVELMVTIAIVAILLAVGLPSFQGAMRSNRVATSTNELMAGLALARTEAIRSTHAGVICASSDGEACGEDWNDGWIVWVDANGDGARAADEPVVRYVQGGPEISLATASKDGKVDFNPRGRADNAQVFVLKPADCPSGQELQRDLSLTSVGQVNIAKKECP